MKYVLLLLLLVVVATPLCLNREHPKIQETIIALITLTVTALFVFFLTAESKPITKRFSTVYCFTRLDNKPLFLSQPILEHYHRFQEIIYREFIKNQKEKDKSSDNLAKLLCDLHCATIMNHLSMHYSPYWLLVRESVKGPGGTLTLGTPIADSTNDISIYTKDELIKHFSGNDFIKHIAGIQNQVVFPKGTVVTYEPFDNSTPDCHIRLRKPLYFDIKIKIAFSIGGLGLGSIAHYSGVSEDPFDSKYGTVMITTSCEASFNKYLVGNPKMLKYKTWSEGLFDDLCITYDWNICEDNIKRDMETTAYHTIMKKLK